MLANLTGMSNFLSYTHHKLKDFGGSAEQVSRAVRSASLQVAESAQRPVIHLDSPKINKEERALEVAAKDGIKEGLIAVITAVESCHSYDVRSNRDVQAALSGAPSEDRVLSRTRSGQVTRKLRLLRAHQGRVMKASKSLHKKQEIT
jgi:hypothetical protein